MTVVVQEINTLRYDETLCIGCGMCTIVCPQAVFAIEDRVARLVHGEACMECGACERNCPAGALSVDSGPGCAEALIRAALTGGEPTCGPDGCCGPSCDADGDGTSSCC